MNESNVTCVYYYFIFDIAKLCVTVPLLFLAAVIEKVSPGEMYFVFCCCCLFAFKGVVQTQVAVLMRHNSVTVHVPTGLPRQQSPVRWKSKAI